MVIQCVKKTYISACTLRTPYQVRNNRDELQTKRQDSIPHFEPRKPASRGFYPGLETRPKREQTGADSQQGDYWRTQETSDEQRKNNNIQQGQNFTCKAPERGGAGRGEQQEVQKRKRKTKEEDDNPREKLPQKEITTRCAETDLMEVGERRRRPSERRRSARLLAKAQGFMVPTLLITY